MAILISLVAAIFILLMFGPIAAGLFIGAAVFFGVAHWAMEHGRRAHPGAAAIGAALIGFGAFGHIPYTLMAGAAILVLWLLGCAGGVVDGWLTPKGGADRR